MPRSFDAAGMVRNDAAWARGEKKLRAKIGGGAPPKKTGTSADPGPGVPLCPGTRQANINVP